jgi:hypothetical protein
LQPATGCLRTGASNVGERLIPRARTATDLFGVGGLWLGLEDVAEVEELRGRLELVWPRR